jgi:hypothetical protein
VREADAEPVHLGLAGAVVRDLRHPREELAIERRPRLPDESRRGLCAREVDEPCGRGLRVSAARRHPTGRGVEPHREIGPPARDHRRRARLERDRHRARAPMGRLAEDVGDPVDAQRSRGRDVVEHELRRGHREHRGVGIVLGGYRAQEVAAVPLVPDHTVDARRCPGADRRVPHRGERVRVRKLRDRVRALAQQPGEAPAIQRSITLERPHRELIDHEQHDEVHLWTHRRSRAWR